MDRQQFIDGLRAVADFYAANPEMPAPPYTYLSVPLATKEQAVAVRRLMGKVAKQAYGNTMDMDRDFGGSVILSASIAREKVCRKVATGTRVVPAVSVEAHEETIYEWKCDPILGPGGEPEPETDTLPEALEAAEERLSSDVPF